MPELCRFYGIVIQMYYRDHPPPHFHALYSGQKAAIDIETLAFIDGGLPARARGLVIEWAALHQQNCARHSAEQQRWKRLARLTRLSEEPDSPTNGLQATPGGCLSSNRAPLARRACARWAAYHLRDDYP